MKSVCRPKVSIAIPTFNRADYLRMAIESALAQTYSDIEVIVSDNCSTDKTTEVIAEYNDSRLVSIFQSTNIGMMGNWNKCLEKATGKYFILLSDDDLLDACAIEKLVARFEDSVSYNSAIVESDIGIVYCRSRIINKDGVVIALGKAANEWETAPASIEAFFRLRSQPVPCSILMRTDDMRDVGGYDGSIYTLIADAKIWMAVALRRGIVCFVDEINVSYRVHSVSTTNSVAIEEWIHNNKLLAGFCSAQIRSLGDLSLANYILRRVDWFNAHVAASQIESDVSASIFNAAFRYLKLVPLFWSVSSITVIFYRMLRLIIPKSVLSKIKQVLRTRIE